MLKGSWLLAVFTLTWALHAEGECLPQAPCYSDVGMVNAASNVSGALAPNTLVTIYGSSLSYFTKAISAYDMDGDRLPIELSGTGVHVLTGGVPAHMYYVSPTQVNLLIPSNLTATDVTIQLVREGWAGPAVRVRLLEVAPALFQGDAETVVATTADFSVITRDSPARPGQDIILWATGLGPTAPPVSYGRGPLRAASIQRLTEFRVVLDGVALDSGLVYYAGVAPGFGGLYQINLKLPPGGVPRVPTTPYSTFAPDCTRSCLPACRPGQG
jgi:uncharacterized protein (TIGR03437 family)